MEDYSKLEENVNDLQQSLSRINSRMNQLLQDVIPHQESGNVLLNHHTSPSLNNASESSAEKTVYFNRSFRSPQIFLSLNRFRTAVNFRQPSVNWNLFLKNVTSQSFTFVLCCLDGSTVIEEAEVSWLAYETQPPQTSIRSSPPPQSTQPPSQSTQPPSQSTQSPSQSTQSPSQSTQSGECYQCSQSTKNYCAKCGKPVKKNMQ